VAILSFVPHIATVGIAVGTRSGHPENKYVVKKTPLSLWSLELVIKLSIHDSFFLLSKSLFG
jgi:hypothetical protein